MSIFNSENQPINTMIDLGANIGLSSVYFKKYYPNCKIVAVEPAFGNFQQLKLNTGNKVQLLNNAIWTIDTMLYLVNDFRDGKDWSKSVTTTQQEIPLEKVNSVTLSYIIEQYFETELIDLLKIDIEGSEKNLFQDDSFVQLLNRVKVISIEIHDEFECRQQICDTLSSKGFKWFNDKSLVIGSRF